MTPSTTSIPVLILTFFLFFSLPTFLIAEEKKGQTFKIPKIPRVEDDSALLRDILYFRKNTSAHSPERRESVWVLAYTVDNRKILFLKKILANKKRQQDLIFLDIDNRESHHYRFNNPILYSQKKRKMISTHNLIVGTLKEATGEARILKLPELPVDLLIERENQAGGKEYDHVLPSLRISIDNGRERFLLGKVQSDRIQTHPTIINRMFLGNTGRIAIFVLSRRFRHDNLIHQNTEILGFDLYRAITDPLHKVTIEKEFIPDPQQQKFAFQKNFYYNERDELIYSETLFHSGIRKVEGDSELY